MWRVTFSNFGWVSFARSRFHSIDLHVEGVVGFIEPSALILESSLRTNPHLSEVVLSAVIFLLLGPMQTAQATSITLLMHKWR